MIDGSQYGSAARSLHRLALASPAFGRACLDFESLFQRGTGDFSTKDPHILIAGLARSGSTMLLRTLYSLGIFRSLTYRDMPFVMMPGLWRRLSALATSGAQAHEAERAHGDGITVDYDSPEAFEEVFWRCFCPEIYTGTTALAPRTVPGEVIASFRTFVRNALASRTDQQQRLYLSKNNNNILRMQALREALPGARIIVPFREPVQQAASLHKQHQRFLELHARSPFTAAYMGWLGHHEFGTCHRPFRFGARQPQAAPAATDLNYWLQQWLIVYQHLYQRRSEMSFCCFEDLCAEPEATLCRFVGDLAPKSAITQAVADIDAPSQHRQAPADAALVAQCRSLYHELRQID